MMSENLKFINSLFTKNLIERQYGLNDVKIKKVTIEQASENPTPQIRSSLHRLLIHFTAQGVNDGNFVGIIKLKPTKGEINEAYTKSNMFEKELTIYKDIAPKVVELLKPLGGRIEFIPTLYTSGEYPTSYLILEDMTETSYACENSALGFDFEQSKFILEKLAFWHASTAKLIEDNKIPKQTFSEDCLCSTNPTAAMHIEQAIMAFIENSMNLGIDASIADKVKAFAPKAFRKAVEINSNHLKGFCVLNHGDFWTNNILLKYHGTELADVIFIDYQNSFIGSPITDLIYFFTSSVAEDIIIEKRDELLYSYYTTLSLMLNKLEYKGKTPLLLDFQLELLKNGPLEVIFALTTGPYLRSPDNYIQPSIQPRIDTTNQLNRDKAAPVLKNHSSLLQKQISYYECLGLLDWGQADSKVKGLMQNYQRV